MLKINLNKRYDSKESLIYTYISILEVITKLKFDKQQKEVISVILLNGELTKDVRLQLQKISTTARIENILSILRKKKILVDNKITESKFFNVVKDLKSDSISLNINLKHEARD